MQVTFELNGLTPLLMHQDSIADAELVKSWQKDPGNKTVSVAGDDRTPAWAWHGYLYKSEAAVALPAENIMVCLRQAGAKMILKGNKTFKEETQSGMMIPEEFCQFRSGGKEIAISDIHAIRELGFTEQANAVRDLGFRLWAKRARIGQSKHIRVRPRFDAWGVSGSLQVFNPQVLTKEVLEQLFELAGRIGLCDWRPGCKTPGSFGMFDTKLSFAK